MTGPDYPYIRAWGRLMGSLCYYVDDQVHKARASHASQTAVYWKHDHWVLVSDITNGHTKHLLEKHVAEMKG